MKSSTPQPSLERHIGSPIETVWREHAGALLERARFLTQGSDAAADLVQDVFERALGEKRRKIPPAKMRSWLMVILYHRFLDHCRSSSCQRRLMRKQDAVLLVLAPPADPEPYWASIDPSLVKACLPALTATLRVPLQMRLAGASYSEIGERLEIKVNTVGTRIHRAYRALRVLVARQALLGAPDDPALGQWIEACAAPKAQDDQDDPA